MIKRKLKDALRENKVRIYGVPFIHRITENKFDTVETWVRADGHGMIRKTDDDRFGARYEMWNDIAKKYETHVIEPKDEIEEVVDQMEEDISKGEYKKKAREEARKRMMGDTAGTYAYKPTGRVLWTKAKGEDIWRRWGTKNWTDKELEKHRPEFEEKGYKDIILVENDGTDPNKVGVKDAKAAVTPQGYKVVSLFDLDGMTIAIIHRPKTNDYLWAYDYQDDGTWLQGHYDFDTATDAIVNMMRKYPGAKFVSGLNDAVAVKDDYGWEIPADKAWDAYESVKERLGAKKLLLSMEFAMGTDDIKEATKDIATDWDEETEDIDELVELAGEDDVLDAIAQWLSYDDLADYLAFICRMNDLNIPELEAEKEIEVDEDVDVDDALWTQPDNDAGSAGILTKTPAIRYKDYLILTREDGMFDVYTRRDFDLVGTEFKTVEEAKKNIDEGRTEQHTTTESDDFDEDEESIEVEEDVEETAKPDPDAKIVNYGGYRIMKQKDGTWTIIKGGLDLESRKPVKTAKNFAEAVAWLYKTDAKIPFPGNATKSERLIAEYLPAEFKDSVDKVTNGDVKIGLVFAYDINPNKHFEVVGNTATDANVIVKNPKGELEIMATEDLVHDINNGDLILVSKGE